MTKMGLLQTGQARCQKVHAKDSVTFSRGAVGWCSGSGIWIIVRPGPAALAVGTGVVVRTFFFSRLLFFFSFSLSMGDGPI